MAKMRLTYHNGRANKYGVYSAKHNDRNFDITQADHIEPTKTDKNIYWHWCQQDEPNLSFEESEIKYYKEHFEDYLATRNAKSIKQGHKERLQSIVDYHASKKSCPEETIYQIGNVKQSVSKTQLEDIFKQWQQWQKEHYPQVVTLNWAYHDDEQGAGHIQARHVWLAHDAEGREMINQGVSLKEMGIERPEPSKKEGRYNNAKMTYTQMARNKFCDICREHGIEIETKPKDTSKSGKDLITWQVEQDKLKIELANAELQKSAEEQKEKLAEITKSEIHLADIETEVEQEKKNLVRVKSDVVDVERQLKEIQAETVAEKQRAVENKALADAEHERAEQEKVRANRNKKRADNAEQKAEELENKINQLETEYINKKEEMENAVKSRLLEIQAADAEHQRKENEQIQCLQELEKKIQYEEKRANNAKALADMYEKSTEQIIQQAMTQREIILKPIKDAIVPALLAVDTAIRHKSNAKTKNAVGQLYQATKSIINELPDYFKYNDDDKNTNAILHKLGTKLGTDTDMETGDKVERAYKEMWRDM